MLLMKMFWRLSNVDYLSWLMLLLGFCFQFSMGATNIVFYLFSIVCFSVIAKFFFQRKNIPLIDVWKSSLLRIVIVWVFLLYFSLLYSDAYDRALMLNYSRKYAKYLLVFIFSITVLLKLRSYQDLPKYFFFGFVLGGVISFGLSALNLSTGWLNYLARDNIIPFKYVVDSKWISNDIFSYTLFMSIVFLYATTIWKKSICLSFVLLFVGFFCVFFVSNQKTGIIAFLSLVLWLIVQFSPKIKWVLFLLIMLLLFSFVLASNNNKVFRRFMYAHSEFQRCYQKYDYSKNANELRFCDSSIGLRILFYGDSIEQIKSSPFYGHGLANLNTRVITYRHETKKGKKNRVYFFKKSDNPHNEYLLQGIHLGIPGILILIAIFALAYRHAMQIQNSRRYVYGGTVIMYLVSCLFNSYLLDATQGLFFTIILSFIIAERAYEQGQ